MATRIDLAGGKWIEVKDRRSWADVKRVETAAVVLDGEGGAGVDLLAEAVARITAYVTAWSLTDSGKPSRGYLEGDDFDPEIGAQIERAIETHFAQGARDRSGK